MKKKTKRLVSILAALVACGIIALNVLAYNHAHAMMHFSAGGVRTRKPEDLSLIQKVGTLFVGVNIPRPHGRATPADVGLEFERIIIRGNDGLSLGAWYCPRQGADGLVLLFHGYAVDKSTMLTEAAAFHEIGSSVLLIDFRGSGESSASYTSMGFHEAEDVATAVRYARTRLPDSQVILFGQSMGAVAVLRAIAELGVTADAVILEAVFDNMLNTVRNRFHAMGLPSFPNAELLVFWGGRQVGFDGFSHNPVDYARSVSCPVLFMHGSNDPRATVEEARRVFAAVPAAKEFKEFPSAGHEAYASRFPTEWKQAVREVIEAAEKKRMRGTP